MPMMSQHCTYNYSQKGFSREKNLSRERAKNTVDNGYYYYGARYYDPKTSIWLSVDPLSAAVPSMTPYRFCFNNPVNVTDPTGLLESTDVTLNDDSSYSVQDVHNDGDNNIYVVDENGERTGEVVGKTEHWDEFMNHDKEGNTTTPMKGATIKKLNAENYLNSLNQKVIDKREEEGLYDAAQWTKQQSDGLGKDENMFDIKKTLGYQTGYYYKGYYYTGRSLGNMLAGMNAAVLKPGIYKASDWWSLTIQMAGDLHMRSNNLSEKPHNGRWRGEIDYAGRMIFKGFNIVRKRNGWIY